MELLVSNVVIAARQFNPSILSQLWLMKNQVVLEDEFESGSIFSEALCNVQAKNFQLFVVPEVLQFRLKSQPPLDREGEFIAERIGHLVQSLPHTPFTAIGVNFIWNDIPQNESISDLTRRLFFRANVPSFARFDTPDARFGSYASVEFRGVRLKVDIKPVTGIFSPDTPPIDALNFSFNFHKDLSGENILADIEKSLALWDEAKQESRIIAEETMRRGD